MRDQIFQNKDGSYIMAVTKSQVAKFKEFNARSRIHVALIGGNCEGVEIVEDNDPRADMITSRFFGMTVGILPDGSAHS